MNHPCLGVTLDLMHAQAVGTLTDFVHLLSADIVNIHASDVLLPTKRVAVGKGTIDWNRLVPKLHALPNLQQITVELSHPQPGELQESIKILSTP